MTLVLIACVVLLMGSKIKSHTEGSKIASYSLLTLPGRGFIDGFADDVILTRYSLPMINFAIFLVILSFIV